LTSGFCSSLTASTGFGVDRGVIFSSFAGISAGFISSSEISAFAFTGFSTFASAYRLGI